MSDWVEWLSNGSPPWATYRALICRRLVTLDKQPGVRPVAIGEIWQRCIAKGNLAGSGANAKGACGSVQLCAGLEAGIKGALQAVRLRAETNGLMQFVPGRLMMTFGTLRERKERTHPGSLRQRGSHVVNRTTNWRG